MMMRVLALPALVTVTGASCFVTASVTSIAPDQERRHLQEFLGVTQCDELEAFGRSGNYMASKPMPFCANHGICRDDYADHLDEPCFCQAGYTGPHCEFIDSQVPTCTLPCRNEGKCMVGAMTMEEYLDPKFVQLPSQEQQYCMCETGFYGNICQTPGVQCGSSFCYNGGTCLEVTKTDEQGEDSVSHHCDCTSAGDEQVSYAGDSCEFAATTICSQGLDHNGRHFCVNGGTCIGESHLGCNCADGFIGPVCEFVDAFMVAEECTLECFNHGICRKGVKDLSILKNFGLHHRHLLNEAYNSNFEHCVCPGGYAGLQCEYEVDICPGQEHLCMNGGDCDPFVIKNGHLQFTCDCSEAKTQTARFTGAFCEMESTEFCTVDKKRTAPGKGEDAFCTNNGKCLSYVAHGQEHPGCDCPLGFEGNQCEVVGVDVRVTDRSTKKGLVASTTIVMMILTLLVLGILFSLYAKKRRRKRELSSAIVVNGPEAPELNDSWLPNSDLEHEIEFEDNFVNGVVDDSDAASHGPSQSGDSTLGGNSTASTITMEEQPDGRVTLMKTDGQVPVSTNSADSTLHIFKDSHDDDDASGGPFIHA